MLSGGYGQSEEKTGNSNRKRRFPFFYFITFWAFDKVEKEAIVKMFFIVAASPIAQGLLKSVI